MLNDLPGKRLICHRTRYFDWKESEKANLSSNGGKHFSKKKVLVRKILS